MNVRAWLERVDPGTHRRIKGVWRWIEPERPRSGCYRRIDRGSSSDRTAIAERSSRASCLAGANRIRREGRAPFARTTDGPPGSCGGARHRLSGLVLRSRRGLLPLALT
jgi:hypothetical protein